MDERIDAFLDDLEAMHTWRERHARRGEFSDELAMQAAERTLLERLRGSLGEEVRVTTESREITGTAAFLGAGICVIAGAEVTIVSLACLYELRTGSRRHDHGAGALEKLGMGSALRRLAAWHEEIVIELRATGRTIRGRTDMVAADYVEIAGRIIPLSRIATVQARVNPFA
ncbi:MULTISPECIES: hypothetical protein [unclassified Brevibacterium]|uniref:hypothetical protein n=1 Tax=unclassified Brevibacterium TaxID=2614124 RepID=UPI0010F5D4D7|nr:MULTISPECIES: hypothetical protein [unclassified Brevibacterium]MCM1014108.1 hypothetical protein [Brevibacterium sp. XM4083]